MQLAGTVVLEKYLNITNDSVAEICAIFLW